MSFPILLTGTYLVAKAVRQLCGRISPLHMKGRKLDGD
jgi:hypothetical protein